MAEITTYDFNGLDFLADLGADIMPALDNMLAMVKDKPSVYVARMGHTLLDSKIVTRLKEAGTADQKALAARLKSHVDELKKFPGSEPMAGFVRTDIRQVIQQGIKLGMADEAQQFLEYASDVAQEALKQAEDASRAVAAPEVSPAQPAAAAGTSPAAYQPPGAPRGLWETVKDNWVPIAIVGAGGLAALMIALMDRRRPAAAVAGLGTPTVRAGAYPKGRRLAKACTSLHRAFRSAPRYGQTAASLHDRAGAMGCSWVRRERLRRVG